MLVKKFNFFLSDFTTMSSDLANLEELIQYGVHCLSYEQKQIVREASDVFGHHNDDAEFLNPEGCDPVPLINGTQPCALRYLYQGDFTNFSNQSPDTILKHYVFLALH